MTSFDIELVGKIGSMALIDKANNDIDYNVIARISRELKPGYMWVTSGATEIGRLDYIHRVGNELRGDYADIKTDYAAQGQSILLETYRRFMDSRYSLRQFLVEHQHFNDPMKREHLKAALLRCPLQGAIPIINYNDPVCSEENRKMEIQALRCSHSKVVEGLDGIYTDIHNADTLVRHITGATAEEVIENIEYYQHYCDGASRKGANGARAKLEYVKDPVRQGTTVMIANSKYGIRDVLEDRVPYTKISISK